MRLCKCGQPTRGGGQRDCKKCHAESESRRRKEKRPSKRLRYRMKALKGILSRIKTKNSPRNRALLREAHEMIDTIVANGIKPIKP